MPIPECDAITYIYEVVLNQLSKANRNKPDQFILLGSINCLVYLINYGTNECIYKFDLPAYRVNMNYPTNDQTNILGFLVPYF